MDSTARLASVILCAGASRRLGQPKQALSLNGETLLLRMVRLARVAGDPQWGVETHVVSGANAHDDAAALADSDVTLHVNEQWQSGMASSLACGARAVLGGAADGVLVLLVDQYRVRENDLERLLAHWRQAPQEPAAARYAGVCGVPAIWPRPLLHTLLARGMRGRDWFTASAPRTVAMPAAAYDLDLPEHLVQMQRYAQSANDLSE